MPFNSILNQLWNNLRNWPLLIVDFKSGLTEKNIYMFSSEGEFLPKKAKYSDQVTRAMERISKIYILHEVTAQYTK